MKLRTIALVGRALIRQSFRIATQPSLRRDMRVWLRSQDRSPLDHELPWITFAAARELADAIVPGARVLEFGSGGSTLWFVGLGASVLTVEHDAEWAEVVRERLGGQGELLLIPPDNEEPGDYGSTDARYHGMAFRSYAAAADRYADGHFDVLMIDGRARVACFKHAYRKVRPGGVIVLDNSDRAEYGPVMKIANDWIRHRHFGPTFGLPDFTETTIWRV